MNNFRLFLENEHTLASWVTSILNNRYDRSIRLVFADWLDERNDPLGQLVRLGNAFSERKESWGKNPLLNEYNKLFNKLDRILYEQYRVHVYDERELVWLEWTSNGKLYYRAYAVQGNQICRLTRRQNIQIWVPQRVSNVPEGVLKGIVMLLTFYAMNSVDHEQNSEFNKANIAINHTIRSIINRWYNITQLHITSLRHNVDYIIQTLSVTDEEQRAAIEYNILMLANILNDEGIHPELQTWLKQQAQTIHNYKN